MRRTVRVGLVVLGAAMAVYGAASLTGGWLGTPPWWERAAPLHPEEYMRRYHPDLIPKDWFVSSGIRGVFHRHNLRLFRDDAAQHVEPRDGRELISLGIASAGLALVMVRARPRRREATS